MPGTICSENPGKSREEREAAGTLLDLSLESVVSVEEAEIEGLHEMEEQIVDQFPEPLPDDEPIDSHVDRDTQTDKKMLRECTMQVRRLFQKRKQLARLTTKEQFVFTLG